MTDSVVGEGVISNEEMVNVGLVGLWVGRWVGWWVMARELREGKGRERERNKTRGQIP